MSEIIYNDEQIQCVVKVNDFILGRKPFSKLLINGSAGTGKTTIIISSIVNILIKQIVNNIDDICKTMNTSSTPSTSTQSTPSMSSTSSTQSTPSTSSTKLDYLSSFIIAAPTNKAKDVLVSKYNNYIDNDNNNKLYDIVLGKDNYLLDDILTKKEFIQNILNKKISFLTVSQVLSISRVINEMGVEEFTKGNDKKIADKYNKGAFSNTSIIVDECSMIDNNTYKLLSIIKCPIIYIGDNCQLPPVKEAISPSFEIETTTQDYILLRKVERCKNDVTLIANKLRDKICESTADFNLLKHVSPDLIIYNKVFSKWLEAYIQDIKRKQLEMPNVVPEGEREREPEAVNIPTQPITKPKQVFDTMALGWTNKCCSYLNKKIREQLFKEVKNINSIFIIKGDKLLVKSPYYKYEHKIQSSNIIYVSRVESTKYRPISFKEWCNNIYSSIKSQTPTLSINNHIDIISILDDEKKETPMASQKTKPISKPTSNSVSKNIIDYFGYDESNLAISDIPIKNSGKEDKTKTLHKEVDIELAKELSRHRNIFNTKHILHEVITDDTYEFTDEVSLKYNLLIPKYDLYNIKKIVSSPFVRAGIYTKWHKAMSILLFGIPNDRICCKKCAFFVNKFINEIKNVDDIGDIDNRSRKSGTKSASKSSIQSKTGKTANGASNTTNTVNDDTNTCITDFITATEDLTFDMFLCDITTFVGSSDKVVSSNIPILDMSKPSVNESLENLRNIIKNSYEVKAMLSRKEEQELNSINKMLDEDGEASAEKTVKYVTLSQLFGHYMSHIITSSYLEVDYGYALTVHKSQGSTYDDVYVEYSNILSNKNDMERDKLLYTAITRGANRLHIYN
uniref:UvrD-like helicase C-terminal domain-containing protein n=1 Tax=viral metagenome TaxID=1070528 RepID=A0A6C0EZM5_9ZZZZ